MTEEEILHSKIIRDADKLDNSKIITLDNFISTETTTTEEKLKKLGIQIVKLGSGKYIINQYPEKGTKVLVGNKVILLTNDSEYKMPNIKGWSSSEVITLCKLLNIEYTLTGNGVVTQSSIHHNEEMIDGLQQGLYIINVYGQGKCLQTKVIVP